MISKSEYENRKKRIIQEGVNKTNYLLRTYLMWIDWLVFSSQHRIIALRRRRALVNLE